MKIKYVWLIVFLVLGPALQSISASLIDYEVLKNWSKNRFVGMQILVSEKSTKEEVMALAKHLRSKYVGSIISIYIFDSKETPRHQDDLANFGSWQNYTEEKYYKHWLVQISINPNTGYDKIDWIAEGRDH